MKLKQRSSILLLAAALTFTSACPARADDGGGTTVPPSGSSTVFSTGSAPALGQIPIGNTGSIVLKNVMLLPEQGKQTVTFTLTVNNEGSSDLLFIDYWVRLKTTTGNQISVHVLPQDKDKNRVTPKSSLDISFYAEVNESTELKDLIFQFIKWDFNQSSFERTIGEIAVPSDYSIVTSAGEAQTIQMASSPVKTSIKKVLLSKNEKNYTPTVVLTLDNAGTRSAQLPGYQYLLRTTEGYMYPLDLRGGKDLTINPQMSKDVELTGSVPVSVSTEGWQLVIIQNAADLKLNLPIAFFAMPAVSQADTVDSGKPYPFTTNAGTYTATLNNIQRLPWEDQDIVTASLTLSNTGTESLPIPDLTGYFMLDDAVKVETKLVRTDKVIGLAPNGAAQFQFVGKIPYTYEFAKIKLVLQEKTAGGDAAASGTSGSSGVSSSGQPSDLLEFVHQSELLQVPYHNIGEAYKIKSVGRRASYKVSTVATYKGETGDTFAVQLEASNLEKRFTDVTKLVAHFKTIDGTVYPANVSEIKKKISPGGAALLLLTSSIPKGLSTTGMTLMIGEAVTEDKLTEVDKKPDAYVNAAVLWLPEEQTNVAEQFKELDLEPYKFSMSKIYTQLNSEGVTLTFDYELSKNLLLESNMEGRKLIINLEDENGKVSLSKEFDLKALEGSADGGGSSGGSVTNDAGALKLGKHEEFKVVVNDRNLIYALQFLKTYKLNVYDAFQGQKKLLASRQIAWFTQTD
ncbi:hypothetical protein FPZ49_12450 [Paenibacillus cremeus]|uniref:Uncharacterized protein n=2 Tax=Paenibacillus cremeus TaxID=2163881 RepID=A0A559KC21_9BACL|nr:hypothetical protein FPZ49_12450 [Paenibacillus cremeus]